MFTEKTWFLLRVRTTPAADVAFVVERPKPEGDARVI